MIYVDLKQKYELLLGKGLYLGWSCPEEWMHIVDAAMTALLPFNKVVSVCQIKSKFNSLRIYVKF